MLKSGDNRKGITPRAAAEEILANGISNALVAIDETSQLQDATPRERALVVGQLNELANQIMKKLHHLEIFVH